MICPDVWGQVDEKCCIEDLNGITVGVDVGYNRSGVTIHQYSVEFPPVVGGLSYQHDTSLFVDQERSNVDVSANMGYSHFIGSWYLGVSGEVSFGKTHRGGMVLEELFPVEVKIAGFSSAIKLKCGYYCNDVSTVIYGIGGLKFRNVEAQYSFDDTIVSAAGSKAKLSSPLYTVGLGIERPIYKKLSVSAEYEYTWRNSKGTSELEANAVPICFYIKQGLKEHSFKIGIKYHI